MFILIDMQIAATQLGTSKTFEYRGRGRWIAGTTRIARQRRWKLKHQSWQIIAKLLILMEVMILVINVIKYYFIIDKLLCWCSFFLISTEQHRSVLCAERQKRWTWWTRFMLFFPCSVIILVRKYFYSNFRFRLVFSFFSFFWLLLRLVLLWRCHCIIQRVVLGTRSWNQKL